VYSLLSIAALSLHLAFVLWVIFGALLTRGRRGLAVAHIVSLLYAVFIEVTVLPCPLTRVEKWAQNQSGMTPYTGDFLEHYLETVIYPDVPYAVLVPAAVAVCAFNLGIYAWRWRKSRRRAAAK
jgi:hypothetical protein